MELALCKRHTVHLLECTTDDPMRGVSCPLKSHGETLGHSTHMLVEVNSYLLRVSSPWVRYGGLREGVHTY